jgi:hypothetical protein
MAENLLDAISKALSGGDGARVDNPRILEHPPYQEEVAALDGDLAIL